jgi:xanthine dehydrogenase accessory factor
MNAREFFERIDRLERSRAAFAVATVVVRRAPVSSHLGDRAIVHANGQMEGFVGGSCSRDIVRRQGIDAIRSGRPRLLRIRPDRFGEVDPPGTSETVVVPMSCSSEGAIDVYIEPHVPLRTLLVAGFTPVAQALAQMAVSLGTYRVVRVVAEEELRDLARDEATESMALGDLPAFLVELGSNERLRTTAIVASQGHYDEAALSALLAQDAPAFVGLLASRKRAASVFGVLAQDGIPADRIVRIHNPVGLDIGARSPGDVAVSILAQLIAEGAGASEDATLEELAVEVAIDPICSMEVDVANASHRAEYQGTTYYFCCAHCRAAFSAEPQRYAAAAQS